MRSSTGSGGRTGCSRIGVETFKLSRDPDFVKKLRDVVGVYLHPPAKALVFCVDEKPQVQALDRTEPMLPLRPGIPARQTHDYVRHGTTNLFAALNVLDGTVLAHCAPRKRHTEFLAFLQQIDRTVPKRRDIHLILDNYGTPHPCRGRGLVRRASALSPSLRSDQCVVAQPRGTLVRGDHAQADSPRHVPQPARSHSRHRRVRDPSQPSCRAVHLDGHRQDHPA